MIIILNTKLDKKWNEDDYQKAAKRKKSRIKVKNGIKKTKLVGKVFLVGALQQMTKEEVLLLSGLLGLGQGLKYKGNIKRGVFTTACSLAFFGIIGGIIGVKKYFDKP